MTLKYCRIILLIFVVVNYCECRCAHTVCVCLCVCLRACVRVVCVCVCVCMCMCVWLSLHTCLWTECRHHIQELNKAHHISTGGGKDLTDPIPEGVCLRNSKKECDVQSAF